MGNIKTELSHTFTLPTGQKITICNVKEIDGNTQLTPNIKLWELANNKATDAVKMKLNDNVIEFAVMVQELRNIIGRPFNFNSGYRTPSFNHKIGGSSNSLHLQCRAVDISFPNLGDELYGRLESNWRSVCEKYGKIGGINRYANYVHIDNFEDFFGYKEFVVRDKR